MTTFEEQKEEFLAHYGVKGMKWGVTKARYKSLSKEEKKGYRKRTGKEKRAAIKEGLLKNADLTIEAAAKGGKDVLIKTRRPGDMYPTVMTGEEFMTHLTRGGAMDARQTQVFAFVDSPTGRKVSKEIMPKIEQTWNDVKISHIKKP